MIRHAELADLTALLTLERECFNEEAWSEKIWSAELAGSHFVDVIEVDARIIACAVVMLAGDDAELLRIAVSPEFRGTGLATRLLKHALERAGEAGAQAVFLEVESDNIAAKALYDSLGFVFLSQRADYYGTGRNAEILSRQLGKVSVN